MEMVVQCVLKCKFIDSLNYIYIVDGIYSNRDIIKCKVQSLIAAGIVRCLLTMI